MYLFISQSCIALNNSFNLSLYFTCIKKKPRTFTQISTFNFVDYKHVPKVSNNVTKVSNNVT